MIDARKNEFFSVTVGNVTYKDFPTCGSLLQLSTTLVKAFMYFARRLCVCTPEELTRALSPVDPDDINRLLTKIHRVKGEILPTEVDPTLKTWQAKKLRGNEKKVSISLSEALENVGRRTEFPYFSAVQEEVGTMLANSRTTISRKGLITQVGADRNKIARFSNRCSKCKPIKNWREALQEPGYIKTVIADYFPNISCQTFARYLFCEPPTSQYVIYDYCTQHDIKIYGRHFDRDYLEEYIAFIKWTGNDAEDFIKEKWKEIWEEETF